MSEMEDRLPIPDRIEPITNTTGLGKAMKAINPQQRAFVRAYVLTGGTNATRACAMSGYGNTDESRRAAAWRLTHDPKILAAIKEAADSMLRANILIGSQVLVEIAQNIHHKDRLKAATKLLEYGGLIVAAQHNVNLSITEETPNAQIIDRIKDLSNRLGLDPALLLGRAGGGQVALPAPVATDAEYEVVTAPSSAGLEDLL